MAGDGLLRLFPGAELRTGQWTSACAFAPDGRLLAITGSKTSLYDVGTGAWQQLPAGGWTNGCAFAPDGSLLAVAAADGTVQLWDMPSGARRAVLTGHTGSVHDCRFSPDGSLLLSAGREARLWDVASPKCVSQVRVAQPLFGWTGRRPYRM